MASSGAMTAQTFSCIIPRSPATVIAPCKKETWSTSRLCRGRRARKLPTWLRLRDEEVGNYSAGRERPPAGLFYLETRLAEGDGVNAAYSASPDLLDKLW